MYSGSALNDAGVAELLDALCLLAAGEAEPGEGAPFSARVFKVRHDAQGNRLCFFKVLSGTVAAREEIALPGGEKAKGNELRLYSGTKFTAVPRAEAGMLCAALGLPGARP
ncbi:MAG: elongation factor G, partial [Clostridia bacterium]|nr:elongation factor G [Clostridia bacterium]